jgi:acetyl/propionyl-CoA carboxylase alpha subunit
MQVALRQCVVLGPITNGPFLLDLLAHPAFIAGHTHTGFLAEHFQDWQQDTTTHRPVAALAAALGQAQPRPAQATNSHTTPPSPWTQLGGWRVGQ